MLLSFGEQATRQPRHLDRCPRLPERRDLAAALCRVQCAEEDNYSRGKFENIHKKEFTTELLKFDLHVTVSMLGMWTDIGQEAESWSESVKVAGKWVAWSNSCWSWGGRGTFIAQSQDLG